MTNNETSTKSVPELLRELQLTTDPKLRAARAENLQKRHKVDLFQYMGVYYIAPKGTSSQEALQHLVQLNEFLDSLQQELAWFRDRGMKVKLASPDKKSYYIEQSEDE